MRDKEPKYILWVEDFAGSTKILSDDYRPEQNFFADHIDEIKKFFPNIMVPYVEIITDPTELPKCLEKHHQDYEHVVLDINFEKGLSNDKTKLLDLFLELQTSNIEVNRENLEKKLGYYLFYYLITRWKFSPDKITFYSAYANDDTKSGYRNNMIGPLSCLFLDKEDYLSLSDHITKTFYLNILSSSDNIDKTEAEFFWAIRKAKDLYFYWKNHILDKVPNESIFFCLTENKNEEEISNSYARWLDRIGNALYSSGSGEQETYYNVLSSLSHPFEAQIKKMNRDLNDTDRWNITLFKMMKALRNIQAHRNITPELSPDEFLLLFSVGMRVLFEPINSPVSELPSEHWLEDQLLEKQQPFVETCNDKILQRQIKELFVIWYQELMQAAGTITKLEDFFYSYPLKREYTYTNIIRMFCIRALNTGMNISFNIWSSSPNKKEDDPQINCRFDSVSITSKENTNALKKLAIAYIKSQLKETNRRPKPFSIEI